MRKIIYVLLIVFISGPLFTFTSTKYNSSNTAQKEPLVTENIYLDIEEGISRKKIIIKLLGKVVPKTTANFSDLVTHNNGFGYKSSIFYQIIKGAMIIGGDIVNNDGTGEKAIYRPF